MCARLSAQMRVFHNSAGVRLGKIENSENSESGRVAAWQEAPCASAWPTRKNSANGENGKRSLALGSLGILLKTTQRDWCFNIFRSYCLDLLGTRFEGLDPHLGRLST